MDRNQYREQYERVKASDEKVKASPRLLGVRACNWGRDRLSCPFAPDSVAAAQWHDGYNHADDSAAARGI